MLTDWSTPLLYGSGVFVTLELVYLLVRRALPRFRLRALYHLWALTLGLLTTLYVVDLNSAHPLRQAATAGAALLSSVVLFILFDALVLQRPWAPNRPPMLPKLARDVLLMVLLVAVVLLVAKEILDQPLGAVLVSSTVLSAVVGLALQDVLKNVFAGMSLDIEKPVRRGDWLLLDGKTPVEVLDVTWRSMRLRTREGVEISEPNSNIASARLVNYGSGARSRAMTFRIGLPYEAPPTEVKRALIAAARSVPDALDKPPVQVFLESFDDHSICYYLRVWTHSISDMRGFKDRVNTRIWYQLKRRDLHVPFPIRTVHMHRADEMQDQDEKFARDRVVRLLSEVDLFRELKPNVIEELAAAAGRQNFDDGEVLVREGAPGDSLFVIKSGSAKVTKTGSEYGGDVELAQLTFGDFFGERSLLTGEDRSASVTADGGCVVLRLSKEAVAPILAEDPTIAEALSRALAAREAETDAALESHRDRMRSPSVQQAERSLLGKIRSFFELA